MHYKITAKLKADISYAYKSTIKKSKVYAHLLIFIGFFSFSLLGSTVFGCSVQFVISIYSNVATSIPTYILKE